MVQLRRRCLLLCPLLACCLAMVHHLDIEQDDRKVFPIEMFGFYRGGIINISLSSFSVTDAAASPVLGILLLKVDSQSSAQTLVEESKATGKCLLREPENLVTIDMKDKKDWKHRKLYKVVQKGEEGLYLIAFSRCKPAKLDALVSFVVSG